jgi:alanine-synthesizing transaminase
MSLELNPGVFRHPSPAVGSLYLRAIEMEKNGVKLYKGLIGDPAVLYPPSQKIIDSAISAIRSYPLNYGHTRGLPSLCEKIAKREKVSSDDVIIGNGAGEIMQMLSISLAGKNSNILMPSPCFFQYIVLAEFLNSATIALEPRLYVCDIDKDWEPDLADMQKKIDDRTRAVLLINPNNPTGWLASSTFLKKFYSLVCEINVRRSKSGVSPLTIISDEVYRDVTFGGTSISMRDIVDTKTTNLVVINSASKADRLSGVRVGYAAISGPNKKEIIDSFMVQARIRISPNILGQQLYLSSLNASNPGLTEMNKAINHASDIVFSGLSKSSKIKIVRPKAGFYIFAKVNSKKWPDSKSFCEELLKTKHVLISPGDEFIGTITDPRLHGIFFRLVYLLDEESLVEMARRIVDFIES